VYFNGDYHGVYLLMERVDGPLLELRRFQSNDVSHACIYKAVDHAANFSQPGHAGYEQREPDALLKEYWQPLDEFNRFASRSKGAEFFDLQTGVGSRLDLDNAVDFYLLVLLTSNLDGITKNFMIAREAPRAGQPNPVFFFVPWDYDGTFGRNWDASAVAPDGWLSNHLFDRLMGDRAFRERLAKRWKALRDREFSAKTSQEMIDTNAHTLGEAVHRNAARWRPAAGHYPDRLSFAEDAAQMKTWIEGRSLWVDGEINRRAAAPP
jgi:spore coat protein CotH